MTNQYVVIISLIFILILGGGAKGNIFPPGDTIKPPKASISLSLTSDNRYYTISMLAGIEYSNINNSMDGSGSILELILDTTSSEFVIRDCSILDYIPSIDNLPNLGDINANITFGCFNKSASSTAGVFSPTSSQSKNLVLFNPDDYLNEYPLIQCILGNTNYKFNENNNWQNNNNLDKWQYKSSSVCVTLSENESARKIFNRTAGILGLSYPVPPIHTTLSPWNSIMNFNSEINDEISDLSIFALNLDSNNPKLDIGGWNFTNSFGDNTVYWSEMMDYPAYKYYYANLFSLSACNVNIFGNYSGFGTAIIDTTSSCLKLPYNYFKSLMSWLPVNCPDILDGTRHCRLKNGIVPSSLPALNFKLDMFDDSNIVTIPLSSLISNDLDLALNQELCILNFPEHYNYMKYSNMSVIVLGNRVLENFYTILHLPGKRVGFIPKHRPIDYSNTVCSISVENNCFGGQYYNKAMNECMDPDCRGYYFQVLNSETKTCTFHRNVFPSLTSVLIILIFGEYLVNKWKFGLLSRAENS